MRLLLPFLLLLSIFSNAYALPQYENQAINKLEIIVEGGSVTEDLLCSIQSRITTKEGGFFSQSDFDSDLKILVRDFDQVEPEVQSIGGSVQITIKVWPKPTIRSIRWCGNTHISSSDLRGELGIKPFTTFDRLSFNKAFHKVKAYYVKKGFFEAELDYVIVPDCETGEVDIEIIIKEGRAGHIKNIIFSGITCDEESDLLDLMVTKEYNFLFSWYTGEGTYHEEAIQQDQFVILNYLQNQGYADARVDLRVEETCSNKINILINITKGPIYCVNQIEFKGNTLFCDADIRQQFMFGPGSPYSPEKIRETITNINDLYGRRGYIDANVDFEPSLDMDCLSYSIKMTIEEGKPYRVGMIKVFGNCTTQTSVILHESLLIPGEIFNIEKLKLTEQKLINVGYFEAVNVYAVKSDGPESLGESYRDVHIEVKETSTGNFGAFFGYSTSENVFGGLNITERNFNYKNLTNAWRDGWCVLRGGGEYAHATIQVGLKSRKYILSWAKPFFQDTPWTVGFDLERSNNRYISDDYEINSTAGIVHATYKINEFLRFGWHYRLKNSNVDVDISKKKKHKDRSAIVDADIATKGLKGKSEDKKEEEKDGKQQLLEDSRVGGLISATGVALTYDSTDHPVTPRDGFKSRLELECAGLGGDHSFFSFAYLNSYFIPIGKKSVLKYRVDLRFILPFGGTRPKTVPLDERLFLGGDVLVRGYRSYRLGPLYDGTDDPRGGVSEQYYSIELTRRLHQKVEAFGFFDAGFLSLKTFQIGNPFCSLGIGARVKIIESIPSLTFGYGVPLNPKKSTQVKKFFISVGGQF